MKIEYLGHSCFYIENSKGVKIITDPYTKVGYELPNELKADIVTVSHGHFDHNYTQAVNGTPMIVDGVGVYEYQGVKIVGAPCWHDSKRGALRGKNIIFKFDIDGVTVCHFGDLGESYSKELAEKLSDADVWLLPIGGTYTIDAEGAKEYIDKLKPKAVIPMHYRPQDGALDIAEASVFLKKMDKNSVNVCSTGSLVLTGNDLEDGKTKIFYMERKK